MNNKKTVKTVHSPYVEFNYDSHLIGKDSQARIFRDVTLLTPGGYADSITQSEVQYPKSLLKRTVNSWHSNYLNIDHSKDVLSRIGYIQNPHFKDDKVKADLYIYPITENAKDVINLIDQDLINWLSVELQTEDAWDKLDNRYVKDMTYLGVAVVTEPACTQAKIDDEGPDFEPIDMP